MIICPAELCAGCFACSNICPKSCIHLCENENGHLAPQIDLDFCINCGLCQRVCPVNNPVALTPPKKAYASWSLDNSERITSASGGAVAVFSKVIIDNGGVVYGASVLKNGSLCHERIDNPKDLSKLKGSKYVQSSIENAFQNAETDLQASKYVLFTGTPCQIAGLKNYLGREYDNLITVDLVCHGVPGMRLLSDHIQNKIGNRAYDSVSFRENGEFKIRVVKDQTTLYAMSHFRDIYYIGFTKALFYRESCYNCRYASRERVSDITIGDFWGLGKSLPFTHSKTGGVSLIMPITQRGLNFVDKCRAFMFSEERDIEEAVAGNAQLRAPSAKNTNAEKFKVLYSKRGFEKAANRCLRKQRIKYILLSVVMFVKNRKVPGAQ